MKRQEELFNIAKEVSTPDFPFDDSKMANILDNAEKSQVNDKNKLNRKLKMTSIGITLTGLVFGIWALNPSSNNSNNSITQSSPNHSQIETKANSINTNEKDVNPKTNNAKSGEIIFPDIKLNQELPEANVNIDLALNAVEDKTPANNASTNTKIEPENSPLYFDIRTNDEENSPIKFEYGKTLENNLMPIVFLNREELKKLNIFQSDYGITYLVEETYPPYSFKREDAETELLAKGYPKKGVLKQMEFMFTDYTPATLLPYDGEDMKKTLGVYPITTNYYIKSKNSSGAGATGSGRSSLKQNSGSFDCNLATQKFVDLFKKLYNKKSSLKKYPEINVNVSKEIYENYKPYYIVMAADVNDNSCKMGFFTFPATSNFISLLPQRYKKLTSHDEDFEDNYVKSDSTYINNKLKTYLSSIDTCGPNTSSLESTAELMTKMPKLAPISRITLTNAELAKLGVIVQGETVKFLSEDKQNVKDLPNEAKDFVKNNYSYNLDKEFVLFKSYSVMNVCSAGEAKDEPIKYTGWNYNEYSKTAPIGFWAFSSKMTEPTPEQQKENPETKVNMYKTIATRMFQSPMMKDIFNTEYVDDAKLVYTDKNKTLIPKISKVIPIRITNNCSGSMESVLDLFFYLNKEFVSLLPERYKKNLEKELEIAEKLNGGKIEVDDACKAIKGQDSYLGLCSLSSSNILNADVFPNPSSINNMNIELTVKKDIKINIDLFNQNGDFVARLASNKDLKQGINKFKIDSKNQRIGEGLYMITFSDDSGERVTKNIIIM